MQLKHPHAGFALTEALVALVILTSGLLGLLWMHQHAAVSQRQQLMRSVAAGIAEDLAERMYLNAVEQLSYSRSWGSNSTSLAPVDCAQTPCQRSELAAWDLQQLQKTLETHLPEGDAAVFALPNTPGWWGIVMAWADPQETYRTDTTAGTPACPAHMSCWRLFFRPER